MEQSWNKNGKLATGDHLPIAAWWSLHGGLQDHVLESWNTWHRGAPQSSLVLVIPRRFQLNDALALWSLCNPQTILKLAVTSSNYQ
jgi:hypothetical protein